MCLWVPRSGIIVSPLAAAHLDSYRLIFPDATCFSAVCLPSCSAFYLNILFLGHPEWDCCCHSLLWGSLLPLRKFPNWTALVICVCMYERCAKDFTVTSHVCTVEPIGSPEEQAVRDNQCPRPLHSGQTPLSERGCRCLLLRGRRHCKCPASLAAILNSSVFPEGLWLIWHFPLNPSRRVSSPAALSFPILSLHPSYWSFAHISLFKFKVSDSWLGLLFFVFSPFPHIDLGFLAFLSTWSIHLCSSLHRLLLRLFVSSW